VFSRAFRKLAPPPPHLRPPSLHPPLTFTRADDRRNDFFLSFSFPFFWWISPPSPPQLSLSLLFSSAAAFNHLRDLTVPTHFIVVCRPASILREPLSLIPPVCAPSLSLAARCSPPWISPVYALRPDLYFFYFLHFPAKQQSFLVFALNHRVPLHMSDPNSITQPSQIIALPYRVSTLLPSPTASIFPPTSRHISLFFFQ